MKKEKLKEGTYCIQCLEEKKVIRETKEKCVVCGWGNCVKFKRHRFNPYSKKEIGNLDNLE